MKKISRLSLFIVAICLAVALAASGSGIFGGEASETTAVYASDEAGASAAETLQYMVTDHERGAADNVMVTLNYNQAYNITKYYVYYFDGTAWVEVPDVTVGDDAAKNTDSVLSIMPRIEQHRKTVDATYQKVCEISFGELNGKNSEGGALAAGEYTTFDIWFGNNKTWNVPVESLENSANRGALFSFLNGEYLLKGNIVDKVTSSNSDIDGGSSGTRKVYAYFRIYNAKVTTDKFVLEQTDTYRYQLMNHHNVYGNLFYPNDETDEVIEGLRITRTPVTVSGKKGEFNVINGSSFSFAGSSDNDYYNYYDRTVSQRAFISLRDGASVDIISSSFHLPGLSVLSSVRNTIDLYWNFNSQAYAEGRSNVYFDYDYENPENSLYVANIKITGNTLTGDITQNERFYPRYNAFYVRNTKFVLGGAANEFNNRGIGLDTFLMELDTEGEYGEAWTKSTNGNVNRLRLSTFASTLPGWLVKNCGEDEFNVSVTFHKYLYSVNNSYYYDYNYYNYRNPYYEIEAGHYDGNGNDLYYRREIRYWFENAKGFWPEDAISMTAQKYKDILPTAEDLEPVDGYVFGGWAFAYRNDYWDYSSYSEGRYSDNVYSYNGDLRAVHYIDPEDYLISPHSLFGFGMKLHAVWIPRDDAVYITFDMGDGIDGWHPSTRNCFPGTRTVMPRPTATKAGYKFVGWKAPDGTIYSELDEYFAKDTDEVFVAVWESTAAAGGEDGNSEGGLKPWQIGLIAGIGGLVLVLAIIFFILGSKKMKGKKLAGAAAQKKRTVDFSSSEWSDPYENYNSGQPGAGQPSQNGPGQARPNQGKPRQGGQSQGRRIDMPDDGDDF